MRDCVNECKTSLQCTYIGKILSIKNLLPSVPVDGSLEILLEWVDQQTNSNHLENYTNTWTSKPFT